MPAFAGMTDVFHMVFVDLVMFFLFGA